MSKDYTCFDCRYYVENDDTGIECQGQDKICHEFILDVFNEKEDTHES